MFLKTLIGLFRSRQTMHGDERRPHEGFKGKIHYDKSKCSKNYACIKNCPAIAISKEKDGYISVDHEKCIRCGICPEVCPTKALVMKKK